MSLNTSKLDPNRIYICPYLKYTQKLSVIFFKKVFNDFKYTRVTFHFETFFY